MHAYDVPDAYAELRAWLEQKGATGLDRLQITDFPMCTTSARCTELRGIGLVGEKDLLPSESIVSVPKSLLMCDFHALEPPLRMAEKLAELKLTLPQGNSSDGARPLLPLLRHPRTRDRCNPSGIPADLRYACRPTQQPRCEAV